MRTALYVSLVLAIAACSSVGTRELIVSQEEATPGVKQTGDIWRDPLTGMEFVYIAPGTFMMGSPSDEPGRRENEERSRSGVQHKRRPAC